MKLGIASDLRKRLGAYRAYHPPHPSVILWGYSPNGAAVDLETHLITELAPYCQHGKEWFPVEFWNDVEFMVEETMLTTCKLIPLSWEHATSQAKLFQDSVQMIKL